MDVAWATSMDQEFTAELRIDILNQQGILADITNAIAKSNSNIQKIATEEKDGRLYTLNILITVKDRTHLAKIMRKIKTLKNVIRISRIHN